MAKIDEAMVLKFMKTLDLTRDEAIQLIKDDEVINKMTKTSEINNDLTQEQQQASKKAKQADRKPTVYKFDTSKRKKAENHDKRFLVETIAQALQGLEVENFEVLNVEQKLEFVFNDVRYRVVLSAPRK